MVSGSIGAEGAGVQPSRTALLVVAPVVTAIWGFNFVVIKVGTDGVPALLLVALRFACLAFPACFFVRPPRASWRLVVGYGLFWGVGQFGLLFTAIAIGAPAGLSSVILQSQAFFTSLLAAAFLGERIGRHSVLGMLLAALGLALIGWHDHAPGAWGGRFLAALSMLIVAGFMWGAANVIARRIGQVGATSLLVWASLACAPPLFVLSFAFEGPERIGAALSSLSWLSVGALAYLVVLSTLVGYGGWNQLIVKYGASRVAPFSMLVPVFGVTSTAVFLGERFTPWHAAAAAFVLAGLGLHVFGARFRPRA